MPEHHPAPGVDAVHHLASAADLQQQSIFFQRLPRELRDKIYEQLFLSTRLTYAQRCIREVKVKMRPARHSLAVLRACRRFKAEIGETWIGQVHFVFLDFQTMLDKLTALPAARLSKMRHFTARSTVVALSPTTHGRFRNYTLPAVLKLLDGLRLDTLTVTPSFGLIFSYETFTALIEQSCGWKELRFLSRSSAMLGFGAYSEEPYANPRGVKRHPEPWHWQSVMDNRDGHLSKPSVVIYRSTVCDSRNSVLDPCTRTIFEQEVPQGSEAQSRFALQDDEQVMADGEKGKEIMIVVRRGSGIDYEEKKDSPLLERDIRRDFEGKSWQEIRSEHLYEEADKVGEVTISDDENEDPEIRLGNQSSLAGSWPATVFL